MFKSLHMLCPVLSMTHRLFPPIFLTTLRGSRDLHAFTKAYFLFKLCTLNYILCVQV